jgi:hypothetical protein
MSSLEVSLLPLLVEYAFLGGANDGPAGVASRAVSHTRCHLWVSHWVPQRRTKYLVCIGLQYPFPVLHVQAITMISQGAAEC